MKAEDIRYIVFMLDTRHSQYLGDRLTDMHEGKIYCNREDARAYANDCVKDGLCNRFVIGTFVNEPGAEIMYIDQVESFGFRHDKTNINQLQLFK